MDSGWTFPLFNKQAGLQSSFGVVSDTAVETARESFSRTEKTLDACSNQVRWRCGVMSLKIAGQPFLSSATAKVELSSKPCTAVRSHGSNPGVRRNARTSTRSFWTRWRTPAKCANGIRKLECLSNCACFPQESRVDSVCCFYVNVFSPSLCEVFRVETCCHRYKLSGLDVFIWLTVIVAAVFSPVLFEQLKTRLIWLCLYLSLKAHMYNIKKIKCNFQWSSIIKKVPQKRLLKSEAAGGNRHVEHVILRSINKSKHTRIQNWKVSLKERDVGLLNVQLEPDTEKILESTAPSTDHFIEEQTLP